jgi:predicted DNA-binding protein
MNPNKAMTLRLTPEQAEQLETVAKVDGKPIAAVIRAAIEQHIEARKQDQQFRQTLQERLTRTKKLLRG